MLFICHTGSLNLEGIEDRVDWNKLFESPSNFWTSEIDEIERYFDDQIGEDLPKAMKDEIQAFRLRLGQFDSASLMQ